MSAGQRRRNWGCHFLRAEEAARIVADSAVSAGDLVLDVGAGYGALTSHLVDAGARVLAVELHPGRAEYLRQRFATLPVRVLECDARDLRLPRKPFRVVANPPYGVSSALLQTLLGSRSRMRSADIVLQRQVARRYADGRAPGAGRWLRTWRLDVQRNLPRDAFRPPPRVDSTVLAIRRRLY